jgi:uncharacterized protein
VNVDTGVLFAAANRKDPNHRSSREIVESDVRLVIPALVVAEAAYLIGETLGSRAETAFIRSLSSERYFVEGPTSGDFARAATLMSEYDSLPLGATDATVIALAERLREPDIATLDRRHFTVVVSSLGPLRLFPEKVEASRRLAVRSYSSRYRRPHRAERETPTPNVRGFRYRCCGGR